MLVEHDVASDAQTRRTLRIELVYLELDSCARCRGAERSLEMALMQVRDALAATEVDVTVDKAR